MKKLLALILIGMMIFALTACSSSTDQTTAVEPQEEKSTEIKENKEADTAASASVVTNDDGLMEIPVFEPHPEVETSQTYDVVVVGAGGAGLASAIAAAQNGASVVVLEQESVVGGNVSRSGAGMNVPGNWEQVDLDIEDSVESFIEDTMIGGDNVNNPKLVETLAKESLPTAEWMRDEVGVQFMAGYQQHYGGHKVPRALIFETGIGTQIVMWEFIKAQELGVQFKMNTKATDLISDETGRVIGVTAENKSGQTLAFNGNYGVILASGGFADNIEMRLKYRSDLGASVKSTNAPNHNGDGIIMAEALGAGLTGMEWIQTYPFCMPTTGEVSFIPHARMFGGIMVNLEGERFVNENGRRDKVTEAVFAQTGGLGYVVWDQAIAEDGRLFEIYHKEYTYLLEQGLIYKADTLKDAAEYFGVNVEALLNTVATYNEYTKDFEAGMDTTEADKDFNRNAKMALIDEGPFYIEKVAPAVHHTMGGLLIDVETHVLTEDGSIIPGLYAAGEVTGGVHGTNRLGGNALLDMSVFGKIAGETIVADQK